ncbi:hypothetical protein BH09PSE2_BH09PSE2_04880 [soil metagenome]
MTTLRRLIARSGGVSLDFLAQKPAAEAQAWLQDALNLSAALAVEVLAAHPIRHRLAHPAPDALRVLARLWGAERLTPAEGGGRLVQDAPDGWTGADLGEVCILIQTLAQSLCHAVKPECMACPIAADCALGRLEGVVGAGRSAPPTAVFLRRRIRRMEGEGSTVERCGRSLGGEAFSGEAVPLGLTPGTHQLAPSEAEPETGRGTGRGAGVLMMGVAAAMAAGRREGEEKCGRAGARRGAGAKGVAPPIAGSRVLLLLVQEADALLEHGEVNPPGLRALGLAPERAAFVRVGSGAEALRVIDEALKLKAAPVVMAELRRSEGVIDLAASRRLNLSARRAGVVLLLITPDLSNTSAAITRWRVGAAPSAAPSAKAGRRRMGAPAFTLELVRNRQGRTGLWTVEWDIHEQRFRTPSRLGGASAPWTRPAADMRPLPSFGFPPPLYGSTVAAAQGRAAA